MGTFSQSWALAKDSYSVLRRTPSLALFPILSAIATIVVSISFFVPVFVVTGGKSLEKIRPEIGYPLTFLFYFLTYFVVIFFNSAMAACAYESFQGRETSLSYGLSVAGRRIGAILGWTAIAATVGVILKTISERSGIIGTIVVGIVGFAWNVATYFVVPVIVIDQGSPVAAVKKSSSLLKRTWGERLVASAGMNLAMMLLFFVGFAIVIGALVIGSVTESLPLAIAVGGFGILYLLVVATVAAALQGIFQTALYLYAETGNVPSGFDPAMIQGAFATKEGTIGKLRNRF
ncbi:DUF6159 family protein [Fimbriimonas ginsengisoli]|uniref:Putative membrane protein n=1 Tax=Fimbriimonas ginsengisoli Gsoil 348 TaxID=661478 RepID=A0A068NJN9_FIMGI|nr:DUF6159 family protein [Fimbriimonas ginsengisoli]AIE83721.1 putative membrane protein [Fimbriimonas ginsengisoli Gsoil 348]